MIEIKKSPTADTRTCDVSKVEKQTLLNSSRQHIGDVAKAMAFLSSKLFAAAAEHDYDKLTEIDWFYSDFKTKFDQTGWWDNHRKIHRHHLGHPDGVPDDVTKQLHHELRLIAELDELNRALILLFLDGRELVANAIRHAKPLSDGAIRIHWKVKNNVVEVEVSGCTFGLPPTRP